MHNLLYHGGWNAQPPIQLWEQFQEQFREQFLEQFREQLQFRNSTGSVGSAGSAVGDYAFQPP